MIAEEDALVVNGKRVKIVADRDPLNLPWKELGVDIVIEATGKFNARDKAALHLKLVRKKSFYLHQVKMKILQSLWVSTMTN